MKTTVRLTVVLPENRGTVQRLYDRDTYFRLEENTITDVQYLERLITAMKRNGGKQIYARTYISDDDLKEHQMFVYESIHNH